MRTTKPLITVIRTVTLPTPHGEFDRLTVNLMEVISKNGGCLVQVSAVNNDFIEHRCRTIYEMWFPDYFDDEPSADLAIERFDELCLEIKLENHLERETIEFDDVIKLMEGDS